MFAPVKKSVQCVRYSLDKFRNKNGNITSLVEILFLSKK